MKNNKILKTSIIFLFLGVSSLCLLQYFLFNDIKNKTKETSSLENVLFEHDDLRSYAISTQKNLDSIKDDQKKVNDFFVIKDGDVAFLEDLESLARNKGLSVEVQSLAIEEVEGLKPNGLTSLRIRVKVIGRWNSLYTFISQIENMPFKVTIERVNLIRGGTPSDSAATPTASTWEGNLEIRVLKYI
ncbi:MAG: hypothetical protein V4690_02550 [Patescibacteria group bacterium]